jgi:hypothetical protein
MVCRCCKETVDGAIKGAKNERGGIGCAVRRRREDGRWRLKG